MVVSGYSTKRLPDDNWNKYLDPVIDPYKKFKKMYIIENTTSEFKFNSELNLKFVRIHFYATTFDRITKDRAAKFVDML